MKIISRYSLYFLIFGILKILGQDFNLKLSNNQSEKLDSVRIYNLKGDLLGISKNGFVKVPLQKKDTLYFVRSGYQDVKISSEELLLTPIVLLESEKFYDIQEVVISNYNVKFLLDKIINSEKKGPTGCQSQPSYYFLKYDFSNSKNTIQKFNGRLKENFFSYKAEMNNDFVNNMTKTVVKNFMGDKKFLLQKTNFSNISSYQVYPLLYELFVRDSGQDKYNLKINGSDDQVFKMVFNPKKQTKWDYNGYIIFDKNNFHVLEMSVNLIDNSNNISNNLITSTKYFFVKKRKVNDNCYKVERGFSKEEFTVKSGVGKGENFSSISDLKETLPFSPIYLKDFDFTFFIEK